MTSLISYCEVFELITTDRQTDLMDAGGKEFIVMKNKEARKSQKISFIENKNDPKTSRSKKPRLSRNQTY